MVAINCLFNYEGVNYRLNIDSRPGKEGISFEELRKNLRDHPKLKEIDLFDAEKYVIEIFDKGFDDYVKLSRDAEICDYTKLRARLRPKSTLTLIKKVEESRKRPLSMYAEINLEEEHAQKVLRGSPPPSTPRMRTSSPSSSSSFRRSHSGITELSRSDVKSHINIKSPAQSKPPTMATPPFKPKAPLSKPTPTTRPQPSPTPSANIRTPVPTKPPVVQKPPDTSSNPFASSNFPHNSSIPKISVGASPPRVSGFQGNDNNLPPGIDQDSYILARAVDKYNDEFTNIVMFDEIWETNHVWPFVFREISGQGVKTMSNMKEARSAFKSMIDKYIEVLQKTHLTEAAANQLWPLFTIFHTKLNIKPFYERIEVLKDTFNKGKKVSGDDPKSKANPEVRLQEEPTPKPQRPQPKILSDDIILLSCDESDKPDIKMEDDEDDIQEVPSYSSPPRATSPPTITVPSSPRQTTPPKSVTEPKQPIVITSDDFRLLMFVEEHNQEFNDNIVPEYSLWRDITDQINLFKPFEPSLVMKYKKRFYELLREFLRIENSTMPPVEKARWKLYSQFINIDTEPFLSKL